MHKVCMHSYYCFQGYVDASVINKTNSYRSEEESLVKKLSSLLPQFKGFAMSPSYCNFWTLP